MICEDCGTEEDVYETICPHDLDMLGIETPVRLCEVCEDERWGEV